jgi:peptidoglycan/LPS O-acetylase OafA/YrhL
MKEASRRDVFSVKFIIKYYVHRYIRLTPPLMIMVMISLNLSKYFGSGPFFVPTGQEISI